MTPSATASTKLGWRRFAALARDEVEIFAAGEFDEERFRRDGGGKGVVLVDGFRRMRLGGCAGGGGGAAMVVVVMVRRRRRTGLARSILRGE